MIRRLVAGLIVVGLAIGVWFVWPRDDTEPTPTTLPAAVDSNPGSTTATTNLTTTTATHGSSTSADSHVVTSVEEAEEILRALWFGWFEGIYNQDEDRIKEVVGTQSALDSATSQFGQMDFQRAPDISDIQFLESELLRSDDECVAVWTTLTLSGFREGATTAVHVLRWNDGRWVSVGLWELKNDRWNQDCDGQLESL